MISNKIKANLFLIITVILAVLFYSYYISINKGTIKIQNDRKLIKNNRPGINNGLTVFSDVEYKSSDQKGRDYVTKGKQAFISKDTPDLINLSFVHSYTTLKDGTVLSINSNKADYFKTTQNIKYYGGVKITNKDKSITAKTASFHKKKKQNKIRNWCSICKS